MTKDQSTPVSGSVHNLRGKLRSVVSHATGGSSQDIDEGLNDICVRISRHRNDVWNTALEKGRTEAATHITTLEAEVEALRKALGKTQWELETIDRTNSTDMAKVRELIVANRRALLERREP